ncbi:threonine/serine dehydratase [Oscillochloris sp. ZM17-4]|uniref:threonine ammonia-lyase n=1 Tax=Oscillochloris sp. ZM17-4 TaxID=2866714 RepID=UPI001C7352D3|nr:threonine/serine dehydratase [Oscillochloris sp. ZM17-4]MBX0327727.1 threonine/serine dehydratase [Oscillochloris sp. ZM17-4]
MPTPADIVAARRRIAGVAALTPLEHSRPLSAHTGAEVYLKLECAQVTGSFKVRGAANALLADADRSPAIACSAGNHALGMAHAAALLGLEVTLVLPEGASPAKVAALRRYPVRLILHGQGYDEAEAEALRLAHAGGLRFISPYNHPAVIAGQGTLGAEIFAQLPQADTIVVGVGGGGLISGVGIWAKAMSPHARVIGVQAERSAAMIASLQAGQIVSAPDLPTLADGLAGNIEPHSITFPIVRRVVDTMLTVSEAQIAAAMRWLLDEHHLVVEGSAAVGVAALLHGLVDGVAGRRVVALLCGRNIASEAFLRAVGA